MGDPYVRNLGHVVAMDESLVVVGVDYDAVVIHADSAPLARGQAEEFGRLFIAACWEAGENKRRMTNVVVRADGDCKCPTGDECPCEADDGDDGLCQCCRDGEHNGSCHG